MRAGGMKGRRGSGKKEKTMIWGSREGRKEGL